MSKGCIPWNKGKRGLQVAWNKGMKLPQYSGKNSPVWKPKIKKICPQCNKKFEVHISAKRRVNCSKKCYWKSRKGIPSPMKGRKHSLQALLKMSKSWFKKGETAKEKNSNWKGGKPKCIDCGGELSHRGHKRCKQCRANGQKGSNHWNWQGGISKDKTKWQRERKRIRYSTDNNYRLMLLSHQHKRRGKGIISVKIIQQVYENNIKKYGTLTCYLCLKPIEFKQDCLEHKQPLSRGGTNDCDNLAIAHKSCNVKKHNKTEIEYRKFQEATNG